MGKLKKRIIPCLDIRNGETVKGVNFEGVRSAGDPVELAKRYSDEGADELVFLDINAGRENRGPLLKLVRNVAKAINIPFTVGGGIDRLELARKIINAGADKVSINSAAIRHPALITEVASAFGSQCVVIAIDTKFVDGKWKVFASGGTRATGLNVFEWIACAQDAGAGEILLTSIDHDGSKQGFAIELLHEVALQFPMPIIASGGAGTVKDFVDVFTKTNVSGALAASIFHFNELPLPVLKQELQTQKIPVRCL